MGIDNLIDVIKTNCPEVMVTINLSELSGLKVAIDVSIFLYQYIKACGSLDSKWLTPYIRFLLCLKKNGIRTVCIFDGPDFPPEKNKVHEERKKQHQRLLDKLKKAKHMKDLIIKNKPYCQEEISKLLITRKNKEINFEDIIQIRQDLSVLIEKLENQTASVTQDHISLAMKIAECLGLGIMQSKGEAETLCAYACVKGYVDAVLSNDTDVLAYGTPIFLHNLDVKTETVDIICHEAILSLLGLSVDEFRDLCIILRCDYNRYNDSIIGYPPNQKKKKLVPIGSVRGYAMIQEYRNFETISNYVEDISPLNHKRCRELLSVPIDVDIEYPQNSPIDIDKLTEFFKDNNIRLNINEIEQLWSQPKIKVIENIKILNPIVVSVDGSCKDNGKEYARASYVAHFPPIFNGKPNGIDPIDISGLVPNCELTLDEDDIKIRETLNLKKCTNGRGELLAFIYALIHIIKTLRKMKIKLPIIVISDCKYLINLVEEWIWINQGDKANPDLVIIIRLLLSKVSKLVPNYKKGMKDKDILIFPNSEETLDFGGLIFLHQHSHLTKAQKGKLIGIDLEKCMLNEIADKICSNLLK